MAEFGEFRGNYLDVEKGFTKKKSCLRDEKHKKDPTRKREEKRGMRKREQ